MTSQRGADIVGNDPFAIFAGTFAARESYEEFEQGANASSEVCRGSIIYRVRHKQAEAELFKRKACDREFHRHRLTGAS